MKKDLGSCLGVGKEGGKVVIVVLPQHKSVGDLEDRAHWLVQLDFGTLDEVIGGEDI